MVADEIFEIMQASFESFNESACYLLITVALKLKANVWQIINKFRF